MIESFFTISSPLQHMDFVPSDALAKHKLSGSGTKSEFPNSLKLKHLATLTGALAFVLSEALAKHKWLFSF